jgi:hypothetical protein
MSAESTNRVGTRKAAGTEMAAALPGIEGHRKVVEPDVVFGQREVAHHRAAGDLDIHGATGAPVNVDDRVLHAVAAAE